RTARGARARDRQAGVVKGGAMDAARPGKLGGNGPLVDEGRALCRRDAVGGSCEGVERVDGVARRWRGRARRRRVETVRIRARRAGYEAPDWARSPPPRAEARSPKAETSRDARRFEPGPVRPRPRTTPAAPRRARPTSGTDARPLAEPGTCQRRRGDVHQRCIPLPCSNAV